MARVLIPFSDFASGQRAVRRLLQEARDPRQSVELLAMVDPQSVAHLMDRPLVSVS